MTTATPDLYHAQERVGRGAAFLDAARPGWRDEINPERLLDMSLPEYHVFGHLYGSFKAGCEALGIDPHDNDLLASMGFDKHLDTNGGEWRVLSYHWRRTIY